MFSISSSLSRLASAAFIPPYWLRQRWKVCSPTSSFWQTWPIAAPPASSASASRSLAMICSGECRVRFIVSLHARIPGIEDSHCEWIKFRGAGQLHMLDFLASRFELLCRLVRVLFRTINCLLIRMRRIVSASDDHQQE